MISYELKEGNEKMIKTANVGKVDRAIRLIAGVVLIAAPLFSSISILSNPVLQWLVPVVGIVFILTALFKFCPLYRLIGASTCKAD